MTRRSHRALLTGVDVDVLVRTLAVGKLVDVRKREIRSSACASSAPTLAIERREHAVGADAGLDVRGRRRTIPSVEMLFLAIERQLDRNLCGLCEARTEHPFRADL